jgi:simple sugar transport system permease protein
VPGFLKARTGAHEVITTLMLNAIAPEIMVLAMGAGNFSGSLTPIADVPLLFDLRTIRLDWGFVVALLMAAAVSFMLFRTRLGFELRATGFSRTAARSAGMSPGRSTMLAMTLSGGLAGMGSAFLALGPVGGLGTVRDIGFVALALALLAGLRPSGVVLAALLYGALNNGAQSMVIVTGIPLALLVVIVALAIMFVAAPGLIRSIWRVGPARQDPNLAPVEPVGGAEGT